MTSETPNVIFRLEFYPNEKTILSNSKKYENKLGKRQYYSSQSSSDYIGYVSNGVKNSDYIAYAEDNQKSKGIFNQNGFLSEEDKANLRKQLRTTESVIWDGIISFKAEFGKTHVDDTDKAIELLKRTFPVYLKNAGLDPDNIIWYAGLHENTENKHIHISFFEKQESKYRAKENGLHFSNGLLSKFANDKFKQDIELKLLNMQTYKFRDKTLESFKLSKKEFAEKYKSELLKLALKFPPNGRLSYDSLDMKFLKSDVDKITKMIIDSSQTCKKHLQDYEKAIQDKNKEIMRICRNDKAKFERYKLENKYLTTLYSKFGNMVLKEAKKIKNWQDKIDSNIGKNLKQRRYKKQCRKNSLDWCLKVNAYYDELAINTFYDHIKKLEMNARKIEKEQSNDDSCL